MALLIIVLGALLAGAGAFFIVLGFDIVMTDRGAAMTMAGTTALAGGIVTMALGCAILRLTQLLRVAESRPGPVADSIVQPEVLRGDVLPASVPPVPEASAAQPNPLLPVVAGVGATLAVAAGASAAGLAAARMTGAEPEPLAPAGPTMPDMADLDSELMKAFDLPASSATHAQDAGVVSPEERFDRWPIGLDLPEKPEEPRVPSAFDDILDILKAPQRSVPRDEVALPEMNAIALEEVEDPGDVGVLAGGDGLARGDGLAGVDGFAEACSPSVQDVLPEDQQVDIPLFQQQLADETKALTLPEPTGVPQRDGPAVEDQPQGDKPEIVPQVTAPARTVLGSYNARGRVYTMFSDGSVEAVTDHGVESFASMQELREHLARN